MTMVKRTTSFGRKRVSILNHMNFDSVNSVSTTTTSAPTKKQFLGNKIKSKASGFCSQKSLLEALPQEILVKILCGVEHDDLKNLFLVSKLIRETALIAKKSHFEYLTPKKIPAFRDSSMFDEIESPSAPKQLRVHRSRLTKKNSADICVSLFDLMKV